MYAQLADLLAYKDQKIQITQLAGGRLWCYEPCTGDNLLGE